ncbi:Solvent efflux pump periplasmic linker SrpA [BD1-7 clade bacterium]|uniref:Solvent efflux pump periplasmic linker SrpA n=1 Tax=BD1-7 clade bacterium TaxID=2029982 RepID=A0A5S9N6A4_9GAMM|nr:Solvent efflux pump periplasmic linker SrpA [BD1-7 clade bacterium]
MLFNTQRPARLAMMFAVSSAMLLVACGGDEPPIVEPDRLVRVIEVGASNRLGDREFPAVLEASKRANLSFRINGTLEKLPMKEGDRVKKGQMVAQLSRSDAANQLADRKAAYKRSSADFERAKKLLKTDFISRKDYDEIKARYQADEAGLKQAERNMTYTGLIAPFDGFIANRYVQNHEEVVQGQNIYTLLNTDTFDVKFEVPEQLMLHVSSSTDIPPEEKADVKIRFASRPNAFYTMNFKEVATKADPERQTFEVTYMLPKLGELNLLPGMTGTVIVQLANIQEETYRVPSRVVVANSQLQPQVWVFDKNTGTVKAKAVTVGRMTGEEIEVLSGVQQGDVLVSEAAGLLHDGEAVRLHTVGEPTEEVK